MDIRQYIEMGIPIPIGISGENNVDSYKFGYGDWVSLYGDGVLSINHQRPGDEYPYPCTITTEDFIATWEISATDTQYSGQGRIQVVYMVNNVVKKTMIGNTLIESSLGENVGAVDPIASYIDTMVEIKNDTYQYKLEAKASADTASQKAQDVLGLTATASVSNTVGIPNVDVAVTQDGDHKNMDFAFTNLKGDKGEDLEFYGLWDRSAQYVKESVVTYEGGVYYAIKDVPSGTWIYDIRYWLPLHISGGYATDFGILQNEEQESYTTYGEYIDFGEPNEPPLLNEIKNKGFDVIAHFYNDFGLKSTAMSATQAHGNWKWYDWSWNFTSKETYDPSRHPILGWYQGDDRKTLDWILYWLGKAGVNVLSIVQTGGINISDWDQESSTRHWFYVLMNECKNISAFKVMPWMLGAHGKTTTDYYNSVSNVIDFVSRYKNNVFTYNYNGKHYVCCFCWEFEGIRGAFDNYNGDTNTLIFLKDFAAQVRNLGFDGVCIIGRHTGTVVPKGYANVDSGLIIFRGYYSDVFGATTYQEYAEADVDVSDINKVLNVITARVSSPEHSSTFNTPGSTPALFQKAVNKSVQAIVKYGMPKMMTIDNVSEWAENGAGLIPNMKDGFGYLDALAGCQTILEDDTVTETESEYPLIVPVNATGDIVEIQNASVNVPIKAMTVAVEPVVDTEISARSTVSVNKVGINLVKTFVATSPKNAVTFTLAANGVVNAKGTPSGSSNNEIATVKLKANQTYFLSGCPSGGGSGKYGLGLYIDGAWAATDWGSGASYTPTTDEEASVRIRYWYNYAIDLDFSAQVEVGSTASAYVPYSKTTFTTALHKPTYGGTLDVVKGEMISDRTFIELDGTEEWEEYATGKYYVPVLVDSASGASVANKFVSNKYAFAGNGDSNSSSITTDKRFYAQKSYNRIWVYDSDYATLDAFKETLSTDPLQIVYPTTTTEKDCVIPVLSIVTDGINRFDSDSGIIDMTYYEDLVTYLNQT